MSNTKNHAERELEILVERVKDPIIKDFIPEILALCEKFGNSGQSGGSAPYVASAISQAVEKLCLHKPICPILGTDDEWSKSPLWQEGGEENTYQNNRLTSIFKEEKTGRSFYLNAICWKDSKGHIWNGPALTKDGERLSSAQYIKAFPFVPQEFIVDVIDTEEPKDNWTFTVKDERDLEPVFEIYERK